MSLENAAHVHMIHGVVWCDICHRYTSRLVLDDNKVQ